MFPTYRDGDYLIAKRFSNHYSHGDTVVIFNDEYINIPMIKRIVGLPGEKLEIKNSKVFVNGNELKLDHVVIATDEISVNIPPKKYYMLTDQVGDYYDSRKVGPISENQIMGKIIAKYSF